MAESIQDAVKVVKHETHQLMAELEYHSRNIHDSVIYGELDNARISAAWLAQHAIGEDASDMEVDNRLKFSRDATALANAKGFDDVSLYLGRVFSKCGVCHSDLGLELELSDRYSATYAKDYPNMKIHNWAAKQLYAGLFVPSDEHWKRGAIKLATANFDEFIEGTIATADKSVFINKINQFALRAINETDVNERAKIYGDIIITCNGCHEGKRPHQ